MHIAANVIVYNKYILMISIYYVTLKLPCGYLRLRKSMAGGFFAFGEFVRA